jgi:hypothetical protein
MNYRLFLSLSQKRIYWKLRSFIAQVVFWIGTQIFTFKYAVKERKFNYQSFSNILSITQKPLFFAIGFAVLIQYIDPYLYRYCQKLGLSIPDDSDYVTLLATVSGIGGVFIGLYYAGISAISSAIYARVPNNVRDLLTKERLGNVYLQFLSFLTSLCLILISFRLINLPRIFLAIPIVTIFAGIGIISFVKLGQHAFYLFDPTKLSHYIFEQMGHWIEMVKAGGFRWMDKSFQNHAHRQASSILDTLETLTDITAKEPHLNCKPFINLSQNLLQFLKYYEYAKRSIPTESAWYEKRYQHRDWYRTDSSQVAIAHSTGTTLHPIEISNKEWIEDRVVPLLNRCIEVNLAQEKYADILGLFGYFESYLKRLGLEGKVRRAFILLDNLALTILNQLAAVPVDGNLIKEEVLEKLAIAEQFALLPISVALGYREKVEKLQRKDIENRLSSVRWKNDISIYRHDFPTYCLERLEWFKPRINFERMVEGKEITPRWYLTELVCQIEAEQFADNIKAVVSKGAEFYNTSISKALSNKHPWIAAAIMSREWEYWHKVRDQILMWPDKWADLSNVRRIDGLPWTELNINSLKTDSDNRQKDLLKLMSQQNIFLALMSRPENYPDYAGQFLHTSGEMAFNSILTNDIDLLKSVFRPYLFGCMLRFDSLRPKSASTDWRAQQEVKIAAAALLDVMDISGYARLLADYHGNESLWNEITAAWNDYLTEQRVPSINLLAAAVILTESAFEIPHRGVLRTSWQLEINRKLNDVPRHEEHRRGSFSSYTVVNHASALIRIFARDHLVGFYDGIDIFIEYYLRHFDAVKDFDFGRKRRDLKNSIDRENKIKSKEDDKEGVVQ